MAQNITIMNASYSDVPAVTLPKTGGGTALFTDVTPTTATDSDVASGKIYFKADGSQSTGTASGGGTPTLQTKSKSYTPSETQQTEAVTYDSGYDGLDTVNVTVGAISSTYVGTGVTRKSATTYYPSTSDQTISASQYLTGVQTIKAVSQTNLEAGNIKSGTTISISNGNGNIWSVTGTYTGGGSGLTLLKTYAMGTLSTSSTSASDTGKSTTVTGYNDYDVLVVDVSVDTVTNNRHTSTVSMVYLTGTSNVTTKNTYTVGSNKWNSKLSSSGTGSTRQSTTAYGIYVNSATVSSSTMTLTFYYRYNSSSTGTINGTYTARIYGLKLYDLIGG